MTGKSGQYAGEIKGPFRAPEGVLVHANGTVYVAGAWSGNVVAFKAGKVVGELKGLSSPHDLVATGSGDIWLADAGNDRMVMITPALEIKLVLKGAPYNFSGPRYLDLLSDETLVVADKYSHSIKLVSIKPVYRGHEVLTVVGTGKPGKGAGVFRTPEGVAVHNRNLWFADSGNNRIVRYRLGR